MKFSSATNGMNSVDSLKNGFNVHERMYFSSKLDEQCNVAVTETSSLVLRQ